LEEEQKPTGRKPHTWPPEKGRGDYKRKKLEKETEAPVSGPLHNVRSELDRTPVKKGGLIREMQPSQDVPTEEAELWGKFKRLDRERRIRLQREGGEH